MSVTYSAVPISTITDLQDYLMNRGAEYVEPCRFEVKLYRANQASFGEESKSKSLFTIWVSHDPDNVWSFSPQKNDILASFDLREIFDSKLQSLWSLRQTFKGEGHTYKLDDGSFIRLSNILVQGNYKGLLVDADASTDCQSLLDNVVAAFNLEHPTEPPTTNPKERARMYQKVYR